MRAAFPTLLAVASLLTACSKGDDAKLSWIRVSNARADADKAIARSDHRLYEVYGYASEIPGAPAGTYRDNGCGVRPLEGTSDYGDQKANARARRYAQAYNERVLAKTNCLAG